MNSHLETDGNDENCGVHRADHHDHCDDSHDIGHNNDDACIGDAVNAVLLSSKHTRVETNRSEQVVLPMCIFRYIGVQFYMHCRDLREMEK